VENARLTAKPSIVGIGMAIVDILTQVPHLPRPDEVIEVSSVVVDGGGPVASALATASRLGTPCAFVGCVGDDHWGSLIVAGLEAFGVDATHVYRRQASDSPRAVILADGRSGRRSIMYCRGSARPLAAEEVPMDLVARARVLHLDGLHGEAELAAAQEARSRGVAVSMDGGAGPLWPGMEKLIPLVDLLIVAREFATERTGHDDPREAGAALVAAGSRHVVVTDGPGGAWSWVGETELHQPAYRVEVVDSTGAGDAFHGAYLHAWVGGEDPRACLRFACAVGALACTRLGGRAGLPQAKEVEALVRSQADR